MSPTSMHDRQAGLTLAELMVTLTVFTTLSLVVLQTIIGMSSTQSYIEGQMQARSLAERLAQRVKVDVEFVARVFVHDAEGRYYLNNRLSVLGGRVAIPGSRLPQETAYGYFDVDPAESVETGNLLLVARHHARQTVDVSATTEPALRRVDRLRFVLYFVSEASGQLDLNRWASVPLVRYSDIEALVDPAERAQLVTALHDAGERYAWNPDAKLPEESLYHLGENGSTALLATEDRLPADPTEVDMAMLSRRSFAVARNGAPRPLDVPLYARATADFPHGFEVKVDGTGSGGLLAVQLALVATKAGGSGRAAAQRRIGYREE